MKYTTDELAVICAKHTKWLRDEEGASAPTSRAPTLIFLASLFGAAAPDSRPIQK